MRVVCIGCSITRGQVSVDYVDMLRRRFDDCQVTFVNAGVNYDVAYNVKNRLDQAIVHQPEAITILIGTNDANSTLSPKNSRLLRRLKKLPVEPTRDWYRENLSDIVKNLQEMTNAQIALLSLPVIGEDLNSAANERVAEYSEVVRNIAHEYGVTYLPLHERMMGYLREQNRQPGIHYRPGLLHSSTASMQYFMLRRSLDTISNRRGLQLTTDNVHLNSRGAGMVAELIEEFVRKEHSKYGKK